MEKSQGKSQVKTQLELDENGTDEELEAFIAAGKCFFVLNEGCEIYDPFSPIVCRYNTDISLKCPYLMKKMKS